MARVLCKLVRRAIALVRYLKPKSSLPTAEGTATTATKESDAAVQRVLTEQPEPTGGMYIHVRGNLTSFSDEQRAAIGRYAAEHSIVA